MSTGENYIVGLQMNDFNKLSFSLQFWIVLHQKNWTGKKKKQSKFQQCQLTVRPPFHLTIFLSSTPGEQTSPFSPLSSPLALPLLLPLKSASPPLSFSHHAPSQSSCQHQSPWWLTASSAEEKTKDQNPTGLCTQTEKREAEWVRQWEKEEKWVKKVCFLISE